ncbi:putative HNHc nuclease [Staphylococcus simulans]|uniref:putative HNHc nuclease n=1 Tax=Staphylococcus simulans TaxID=1286 RepID=UPI0021D03970|nr:putative HNHc nuclease [Staphylococcus simulans]UXR49109.1 putative HNHc nuclease [Staphylococcus simulans]
MQHITRYQQDSDGTYSVVATGIELEQSHTELIDNGYSVLAEVKKIFALLNDIERYWGEPVEALRARFQAELEIMNGYDPISLSNCERKVASELIELIIAFMFHHQIPMHRETSELLKEDKVLLYYATINRNCIICGKPHSDLAHHYAIGRGVNRRTMDHYGYEVLALCREHHSEQHNIGVDTFDKKYHLENSWIKVDEKLNGMLKGVKSE